MAIAKRSGRARWMAPVMLVVAGMATGGPVGAAESVVEIPEWRSAFAARGVGGTIVVRRLGESRSFVSDLDGAERGLPPAATFEIPSRLAALEAGATTVDGRRMAAWLARLGYGNVAFARGTDRFRPDEGLRVAPVQQVDFVERLLLGTLPASTRSQATARDAVPGEVLACGDVVRAKAGWARARGDDGPELGWWVGWVERPREVWLFATAVEGHADVVRTARRDVTLAVLERIGVATQPDCAAVEPR